MPCACGGNARNSNFNTQVIFRDGTTKVFATKTEARIAISAAGGGATMKAVPKDTHPVTK